MNWGNFREQNTWRMVYIVPMNKTCKTCGSDDRYPGGGCRPCKQGRQRAYYKRKNEETGGAWKKRYAAPDPSYQAARLYGLTVEEVRELRARGKCDVCAGTEGLSIDHSHETGKVRGLLCRGCNVTLGHVKDDPNRLRTLIEYLEGCEPHHTPDRESFR